MTDISLPKTFEEALRFTQASLLRSSFIRENNLVETESEQLVIGAYRRYSGRNRTFSRNDLYVRVLDVFPKEASKILIDYCDKRVSGIPLQYILGYQTFLNHEYDVEPGVLIPRPETEVLVYEVTQFFKRQIQQPEIGIEIGLGSGCISIELLKIFLGLKMVSSEFSKTALEIAEKNAKKILGNLDRLKIIAAQESNMIFEPFETNFHSRADFIVSNPPYLTHQDEVSEEVRLNEPNEALFAPKDDPLYFYKKIIGDAPHFLKLKGSIFFEIPHERSDQILNLFNPKDWSARELLDLTGRPRVIHAEWLMGHWS